MTIVVDASVIVAALVDSGIGGRWSEKVIASDGLIAPELLLVETTNVLRRLERTNTISPPEAAAGVDDWSLLFSLGEITELTVTWQAIKSGSVHENWQILL